jgi:hypothetical protein
MPMTLRPTDEQQAALDAAATGENVLMRAGAGSGKTATLCMIAEAKPDESIIFVAFNVTAKDDAAKRFPSNVTCLTSAGLANRGLRQTRPQMLKRINGPRQSPMDIASILGIPRSGFSYGDAYFAGYQVAGLVMNTVRRFCYSADATVTARHVEKVDGLTADEQTQLETFVVPFAGKAWADLSADTGRLSWGKSHDYYFKAWALTNPVIKVDVLMVDEAQDTNPAFAGVIANQTCQVIMVGDESQAIYGWRGARDAMTGFNAAHTVTLSQSFRFGQAVADVANIFLGMLDAPLRLKGLPTIASTCEPISEPDAILTRTNATAMECAIDAQARGRRVAFVGSMAADIKSFANAADKLMSGKRVMHSDLSAFKSWDEVQQYAASDEGRDLRVMVKLVDTYGTEAIVAVCDDTVKEHEADLVVSTAHKAKGREWNSVRIASDFAPPEEGEQPSRPELMLLYVAVTRAKLTLDHGALAWAVA